MRSNNINFRNSKVFDDRNVHMLMDSFQVSYHKVGFFAINHASNSLKTTFEMSEIIGA